MRSTERSSNLENPLFPHITGDTNLPPPPPINDVISMLVHVPSFECYAIFQKQLILGFSKYVVCLSSKSGLMAFKNLADMSSRDVYQRLFERTES